MKILVRSCLVLLFFCAVAVSEALTMTTNTINAVLGDVSFVKKFGTAPTPASGEALRIQTHLEYVETLLRAEDVSHLSPMLRERRTALLDKLHEYRLTSAFPTNLDFPQERRPCFIDAAGNICAVGFLIEQTAGRVLAEHINAAHRYDFLADMHVPELTAWVEASGLTARECAMIQPQYEPAYDPAFRIVNVIPSVTAASVFPMTIRIQVIGMPSATLYFNPSISGFITISPKIIIWTTRTINQTLSSSATIASIPRINGTFDLFFNTDAETRNYIDSIGLFKTGRTINCLLSIYGSTVSNYYITSTNFTISTPLTSIRDLTLSSAILISPNPVTDALTLALPENELHSVRLTNTLGCAVWTLSEASGTTTLDVSGLSAGVYFVEVQSTRRRSVQKVVKY